MALRFRGPFSAPQAPRAQGEADTSLSVLALDIPGGGWGGVRAMSPRPGALWAACSPRPGHGEGAPGLGGIPGKSELHLQKTREVFKERSLHLPLFSRVGC